MNSTNAIRGFGIVTAVNGADGTPWEGITYDGVITFPEEVCGRPVGVSPSRKFEAGMDIHPAAIGDPLDVVILNGVVKYFAPTEVVAHAPCESELQSPGFIERARRLMRGVFGGQASPAGGGSGSEGGVGG